MPLADFNCKQCGHCCLNLSGAIDVCATEEDIRRWEENDRADILAWVDVISIGEGHQVYDIWVSPTTGDDVARCPWLRKLPGKNKYICRIQDMKPEHCRNYPLSREHAENTGCPGFDGTVRKKRKQGNGMPKAGADPYKTKLE
ncbi:MAG: YkgJ family cysteine cluster protein [Desulfobacterales bacterium]|nr:YkgJ family cysteine cluster protein [Desulfobacterales bacterium]